MQFVFAIKDGSLRMFYYNLFVQMKKSFGYTSNKPQSYILSSFCFIFLMCCCFFGYASFAITPLGMFEFTFVFILIT